MTAYLKLDHIDKRFTRGTATEPILNSSTPNPTSTNNKNLHNKCLFSSISSLSIIVIFYSC